MTWNWKHFNKQKTLFKSYYCAGCRQQKPCQLLTDWDSKWKSYCCSCYFQAEQERAKEYNDYEKVLADRQKEQQNYIQQLKLLREYLGCKQCGSLERSPLAFNKGKEVDAYFLYNENKLVCQPCLMSREGGATGAISFLGQSKWYKKRWGVDLTQWLTQFQCLPVNANCTKEWLRDRNHLNNCQCLEKEVKELVELFTSSLREKEEKLEKCSCKKSEKFRVEDDYATSCEKCEKSISVASKKRVIKNRNDPRFWGLEVEEKVLCGGCLENIKTSMPPLRKAEFNRYRKVKRL